MPSWVHWILFGAGVAALSSVVLFVGIIIGYKLYGMDAEMRRLRDELESLQDDDSVPGDAVINTTPQMIDRKRRAGKLDDEDSAIVTVKSPRELRKQQHERTEAAIDRATGTHR